jgi:hypothetical protein
MMVWKVWRIDSCFLLGGYIRKSVDKASDSAPTIIGVLSRLFVVIAYVTGLECAVH